MKLVLLFFLFLGVFLFSTPVFASQECEYNFGTDIELIAFDNNYSISKYQFPDFVEDAPLFIKSIKVLNYGNCTSFDTILKINISKADGSIGTYFCRPDGIRIPFINVGETYELSRVSYGESGEKIIENLCGQRLDRIGKWTMKASLENNKDINNSFAYSSGVKINGSYLDNFNVISRYDIKAAETEKENLLINQRVMLLTFFSVVFGVWVFYRDKRINKYRFLFDIIKEETELQIVIKQAKEKDRASYTETYLNLFEKLAILKKENVFDENMFSEYFKDMILNLYENKIIRLHIDKIRNIKPDAYNSIEALCKEMGGKKWSNQKKQKKNFPKHRTKKK